MRKRVADLFAGIGGFHLAFERAGAETVFVSEWDKYARLTYETNFKSISPAVFEGENFAGDITKVVPESIPDVDIVTGGFPCQPFSLAGKRGGFEDTRGTLFFTVANIIRVKQPEAFFLENVRGLLSHDGGKTFNTIQNAIHDLGYSFHWKIIRASDFNVPQARPRLFMVGFRDPETKFEFPEAKPLTLTMSKIMDGEVVDKHGNVRDVGFTLRVGGRRSGINDRRNWDTYMVDGAVRTLTIPEAAQMQGFPADWQFPVTTAQAFKQLGNSVAVPAVEATAEAILKALNKPA